MIGTNYISLREVTRLGLRNGQGKLFTEIAYLGAVHQISVHLGKAVSEKKNFRN
jgi:hypothetical protein